MSISCCPLRALADDERDAWRSFQRASQLNPHMSLAFAEVVDRVRGSVTVSIARARDGAILAIWPFQRRRWRMAEPVGFPLSDFQGPITGPNPLPDVAKMMRAAAFNSYRFDHLILCPALAPWVTGRWESPFIWVPQGPAGYRSKEGSRLTQKMDYCKRRLERDCGPVSVIRSSEHSVLDVLIKLKRQQYRQTGRSDPLMENWRQRLLHDLLDCGDSLCAGELSILRAGDCDIAWHFGLRSDEVLHYWFPAFDRKYWRHSPGLLLLSLLVGEAAQTGIKRVDLGTGAAPYKERFATGCFDLGSGEVELGSIFMAVIRRYRQIRVRKIGTLKR